MYSAVWKSNQLCLRVLLSLHSLLISWSQPTDPEIEAFCIASGCSTQAEAEASYPDLVRVVRFGLIIDSLTELHPLPIPDAPWDTASIDFIVQLLESNGKDAIMVIVDSMTKQSHFVSTVTTLLAARTAQLYLCHIWKHHGLPKRVVSDWGPQFIAEFMKGLYWILGVKLAATMAYHPQGDRQTEWINQELEQFLQLFTNQWQDDWEDLLPVAEFQYNNHTHSATQNIPFLLDTGRIPCMGFEPDQQQSHVESVNEFKERMEDTLKEAKAALAKSKDDMAKYYNQRRTPALDYQPRDKVYLDASDIQTTRPSQKLSHRRLGPFAIIGKVRNGAYWLCLPPSMSRLHPIFNVIKLAPALDDPILGCHSHPPPLLKIIDGAEEWIVEEILDSQMINWKLHYLVKWEGFRIEHNSWELANNVHAPECVTEFHWNFPRAPRQIWFVEFDTIPFHNISPVVPGHHSLEGRLDVRGHFYQPTSQPTSQTEYVHLNTLNTFHFSTSPYVPPFHW